MRHAPLRAGFAVFALVALTACSGDRPPEGDAAVSSGDPSACPGEILDVVVSVGAWGDVVRRLGGDCATVTTLAGSPVDAAPADLPVLGDADLVVVNGARYDDWATAAAEAAAGDPVVVSAADVAAAVPGTDPHLWYDPRAVPPVAAAVATELARLSPDAAPYFQAQHATWTAELQPYLETVSALRAALGGGTYAATGAVFGRMAEAVGLTDRTPSGYLRTTGEGREPTADDLATFGELLRSGAVDVLIDAGGDVAAPVREAAGDADVPVVEVTEFPAADAPFVEWQLAQLADLAEALSVDR